MSANALLASYGNPLIKVESADFDGTNDYMVHTGNFTGLSNSKSGILSFWYRIDGGDGAAARYILKNGTAVTGHFGIYQSNTNVMTIFGDNSGGTQILAIAADEGNLASGTWLHFLMSWNLATGVSNLYINDVSHQAAPTLTNDTIDYAEGTDYGLGANDVGGSKINGCLAEFYFAPGQYLDFSIEENRRKFISAGIKPVNLGVDGSLPTTVAPIVYLHLDPAEAPADFAINRGTGGNFSITGALTAGSTSPSD